MKDYPRRASRIITYHGRSGKPVIHKAKSGRRYIMVRAKGGGTKRLYEGSIYDVEKGGKKRRLIL